MNRFQKLQASSLQAELIKQAGFWSDAGQMASDAVIGGNPLDPSTRGMAADIALYSNPFTGVPTGINDTARHLSRGNYLSALGSLGMTGLSFLPGIGSVAGKSVAGAGKGLITAGARAGAQVGERAAGKFVTDAMRRTGSKALERAAGHMDDFSAAGQKVIGGAQDKVYSGMQRVLPQQTPHMTWKAPIRSTVDAVVRNPLGTASTGAAITGGITGAAPAASVTPAAVAPAVPAVAPPSPPPWAPPQNFYPTR